MKMKKCIFLDRDGVLNVERGEYTYRIEDFLVEKGVPEALAKLRDAGFLLVVITNQAGIAKGLYSEKEVFACHSKLQNEVGGVLDAIYFSPYHPDFTESLSRKPGTLLFQKAIAKYSINPSESWMIGDRGRDLIPAKSLGMKTILIGEDSNCTAHDYAYNSLLESLEVIL